MDVISEEEVSCVLVSVNPFFKVCLNPAILQRQALFQKKIFRLNIFKAEVFVLSIHTMHHKEEDASTHRFTWLTPWAHRSTGSLEISKDIWHVNKTQCQVNPWNCCTDLISCARSNATQN